MSEQRPMIENSDRGITLNKQLGWSILVVFVGLIFYAGTTLAQLQSSIALVSNTMIVQKADGLALEVRVRSLENQAGRFDEKLQNILTLLSRIDLRLQRENAP